SGTAAEATVDMILKGMSDAERAHYNNMVGEGISEQQAEQLAAYEANRYGFERAREFGVEPLLQDRISQRQQHQQESLGHEDNLAENIKDIESQLSVTPVNTQERIDLLSKRNTLQQTQDKDIASRERGSVHAAQQELPQIAQTGRGFGRISPWVKDMRARFGLAMERIGTSWKSGKIDTTEIASVRKIISGGAEQNITRDRLVELAKMSDTDLAAAPEFAHLKIADTVYSAQLVSVIRNVARERVAEIDRVVAARSSIGSRVDTLRQERQALVEKQTKINGDLDTLRQGGQVEENVSLGNEKEAITKLESRGKETARQIKQLDNEIESLSTRLEKTVVSESGINRTGRIGAALEIYRSLRSAEYAGELLAGAEGTRLQRLTTVNAETKLERLNAARKALNMPEISREDVQTFGRLDVNKINQATRLTQREINAKENYLRSLERGYGLGDPKALDLRHSTTGKDWVGAFGIVWDRAIAKLSGVSLGEYTRAKLETQRIETVALENMIRMGGYAGDTVTRDRNMRFARAMAWEGIDAPSISARTLRADARKALGIDDGLAGDDLENVLRQAVRENNGTIEVDFGANPTAEQRLVKEAVETMLNSSNFKNRERLAEQAANVLRLLVEPDFTFPWGTGAGKTAVISPVAAVVVPLFFGREGSAGRGHIERSVISLSDGAKLDSFRENLKNYGCVKERSTSDGITEYEINIGGKTVRISLISSDAPGLRGGRDAQAMETLKTAVQNSDVVVIERGNLKSLKMESVTGDKAAGEVYNSLTEKSWGIFDEAHELPTAAQLIQGLNGHPLTATQVSALGRVDSWLARRYGHDYADKADVLLDSASRKSRPRLSENIIQQFARDMNKEVASLTFEERAALNGFADALNMAHMRENGFAWDKDAQTVVPINNGKPDANMFWGAWNMAGARELVGIRRLGEAETGINPAAMNARERLEDAVKTSPSSIRISDSAVVADFGVRTFMTATARLLDPFTQVHEMNIAAEKRDLGVRLAEWMGMRGENVRPEYARSVFEGRDFDAMLKARSQDLTGRDLVFLGVAKMDTYAVERTLAARFADCTRIIQRGDRFIIDVQGTRREVGADIVESYLTGTSRSAGERVVIYLDETGIVGTDMRTILTHPADSDTRSAA
ncbi:MAG TPA: hypothetical protein PKL77_11295, partial [Candidatus Omnitrophota bacterium]|nr:hypothetical protein [Candidatus Omnitrophota bacterium]